MLAFAFIWLVSLNIKSDDANEANVILSREKLDPEVVEVNNTIIQEKIVYVDRFHNRGVPSVEYIDRLDGVIIEDDREIVSVGGNRDLIIDDNVVYNNRRDKILDRTHTGNVNHGRKDIIHSGNRISSDHYDTYVDVGILDRRLSEIGSVDIDAYERAIKEDQEKEEIGINKKDDDLDLTKLTLAKEDDDFELGDLDTDFGNKGDGYGTGKGGQLYAYNFPSKGVGAGIGSSALGAGMGGGAGIGAGIGEGVLNGETVPTLGGVGDGIKPMSGAPAEGMPSAGVGGLVGGAGAGGAAGLTQGYITEKLGMGIDPGKGIGGSGGYGYGRHDYKHLPETGALNIMIHVDGSGSILATRKQLDIMKETLLKKALLPYYKNDESLYNKRVTIIDDSGERTLQFFKEAAKKDYVLAIAFQDEAAPDYHLPNFNKVPQGAYKLDLSGLKSKLNNYNGLYRGIMFQVDRGKVFSKSFKEMIECAWNGTGYLEKENLKKYHRDNNLSNIKNKKGIVFSDEYHAKSEGDPQYYMDLIFGADKKVGIDFDIYGGGLTDGTIVKEIK